MKARLSAMKPKQLLIGSDPSLKHQHMKYIKAIIPTAKSTQCQIQLCVLLFNSQNKDQRTVIHL